MNRNLLFILIATCFLAGCNKDETINMAIEGTMRPISSASKAVATKVFDYTPAPGQFINETSAAGGMKSPLLTLDDACRWAEERLAAEQYVSLGAFGGYIVVGFDHSIVAGNLPYDFMIGGNAFLSDNGGSNEPGIVWVMQDENGNGLPDDTWYELKGSDYDNTATKKNYSVTYSRPDAPGMPVTWTDSEGNSGSIDYIAAFHKQDYYYPAWVESDSYTLTGSCLSPRNSVDEEPGFWNNAAYSWGYADNIGDDDLSGDAVNGQGQRNGFKISNAVTADGQPAKLRYIDFIKVQTAVQAKSGWLGEVSTEVFSFTDYAMALAGKYQ